MVSFHACTVSFAIRDQIRSAEELRPWLAEQTSEEDKNRKDILRHLVEEMHAMQGDALPSDQPPVWWMMHPKCILHRYWDFFVAFNLVYTMLSLPMRICFSLEGFTAFKFWWWIEQLVNIVFVWDIVVNFTTGVYVVRDRVSLLVQRTDLQLLEDCRKKW